MSLGQVLDSWQLVTIIFENECYATHEKDFCLWLVDESSNSKIVDPFRYCLLSAKPVPRVKKRFYFYTSIANME